MKIQYQKISDRLQHACGNREDKQTDGYLLVLTASGILYEGCSHSLILFLRKSQRYAMIGMRITSTGTTAKVPSIVFVLGSGGKKKHKNRDIMLSLLNRRSVNLETRRQI